jgi:hypothetical protein
MKHPILKLSERITTEKPVKKTQPCDNISAVLLQIKPERGTMVGELTSVWENPVDITVLKPPFLPTIQSIVLPLKVMSVMLIIPAAI